MVAHEERLRDLADRRAVPVAMPADREQQLVLHRSEPDRGRLLLAPAQEPAEADAELEEQLVVTIGNLSGHSYIVTR